MKFKKKSGTLLLLVFFLFSTTGQQQCRPEQVRVAAGSIRFTILFFNDLHGNLEPVTIRQNGRTIQRGGIAALAGLVQKIRQENRKKGIRTFLFFAGDMLQGTPSSTLFRGRPDMECFNEMKMDAMTIGNHEFDFGLENFLELKKLARFPLLSANIVWKDNGKPLTISHVRFPLSADSSLTLIGVTTGELMTTTSPHNVQKLAVLPPPEKVIALYSNLQGRGPVILLSHNRYQTDADIAAAVPGLTLIIGGHDQLLFQPPKNASGVPVFQAEDYGKYLGRIDLAIAPHANKAVILSWKYIPVTPDLPPDPPVRKIVATVQSQMSARFKKVIGETLVDLDGDRHRIRYEETTLGDFVADVMRENTGARIALINGGALRSGIPRGKITVEDVFKVMPYPNELHLVELTDEELLVVLKRSVRSAREEEDGGFLHVSGIRFRIRGKNPGDIMITSPRPKHKKGRTHTVVITDFMASGGDGYGMFVGKKTVRTGLMLRELLIDTVRNKKTLHPRIDGRIIRAP